MNIYGCKLVALDGECFLEDSFMKNKFEKYRQKIGKKPEYTVWYDTFEERFFSSDLNYLNSDPQEACYLTSKGGFLSSARHGLPYFKNIKKLGYNLASLEFSDEYIIEKSREYDKYRNSTILILGSGPSLSNVELGDVEFDYIWVCNHFFKNPNLKNLKPSLFYMSNEVDKNPLSFEIMDKSTDTSALFDINVSRNYNLLSRFKNKYGPRSILFSTRLFTTIGTVPRLINLACIFGAQTIKFAGLDGHSEEDYERGTSHYEFEGAKLIPPPQSFGSQRREYLLFWEHIRRNHQKIKIVNLGESYEHNVSRHVLGGFGW